MQGREGAEAVVDPIRQYLAEIGQYPLLTAADEVELGGRMSAGREAGLELESRVTALQDGELGGQSEHDLWELQAAAEAGADAEMSMIQSNLRLVVSIAKRYQGNGLPLLDLIQEGNMGLFRAVEKFDHTKGFKFSTYATWWIRQAVGRGLVDKGRTIRVPSHAVEQHNAIRKTRGRLLITLGRSPTDQEVADEMEIDVNNIRVADAAMMDILSLDEEMPGNGSSQDGDMRLVDVIEDTGPGPDELAVDSQRDTAVRSALDILDDRERAVLIGRFGLGTNSPQTLDAVGQQFNLTRERIRQIEGKALTKLRHPSTGGHGLRQLAE